MTAAALAACQPAQGGSTPTNAGGASTGAERAGGGASSGGVSSGGVSRGGVSSSGTTNNAAATTGRPRVVFLGTSLTAGLGLDPDSAYPALVERKAAAAGTPITVVNAGVSGETSAGALRRVDWVLREPADVIVVETGANDGLRGQRPDSLAANLTRIVERARAAQPRARVALVQMEAPRNFGAAYVARFHAVYPDVARRTGATLLPFLLDGVAGDPRLNQPDGVHPNEEGARRVADTMWRALAPLVASNTAPLP